MKSLPFASPEHENIVGGGGVPLTLLLKSTKISPNFSRTDLARVLRYSSEKHEFNL
jgi:hypothetical protein